MLAIGPGDHSRATSLLQEALTLVRKVGHLLDTGGYLADLGIVALHQGDAARAAILLEEGLMLARQVEDDLLVAECLWGWAAVAAAQGEPARAACLWGAASVRDYALAVPPVAVRPLEDQLLSPARQQLGWDGFHAEWVRGQAMDLDDAIARAVDETNTQGVHD